MPDPDHDPYAGIAERYDFFKGRFGEHDETVVEFFRRLFAENGVASVLDCACGTGHELHLFHSLGYDVHGSDISGSMLDQARMNLAESGVRVPLKMVDYRELPQHYGRQFDAVTCLSSSILHVPNEGEARRAFKSMRQVLRDKGILVLSQGTTDRQWREKPRFILATNRVDFSRLLVIDYFDKGARYNVLDIFRSNDPRGLEVWSTDHLRILLRDDQERILKASGFGDIDFYGTYGFDAYDKETSDMLITVAHAVSL